MVHEDEEDRELHIWQPLLGIYPYILIQFEPAEEDGCWRMGVDYDLMSAEEVIDTLQEIIYDVTKMEEQY